MTMLKAIILLLSPPGLFHSFGALIKLKSPKIIHRFIMDESKLDNQLKKSCLPSLCAGPYILVNNHFLPEVLQVNSVVTWWLSWLIRVPLKSPPFHLVIIPPELPIEGV
jgi:hypothetical protein